MAEETTFNVKVTDGASSAANAAANSIEGLRASVESGSASIKQMQGDLSKLSGKSEETMKAKADLRAAIDAEYKAVSAANIKLLEQGQSYTALAAAKKKAEAAKVNFEAKQLKEAEERSKALGSAASKLPGPLGEVQAKLSGLGEMAGGAGGKMALFVTGAGALIGVVLALSAALATGAVALGKWLIESANAARSSSLMREAITGSKEQADALGSQIDALARKVPTAKSAIQDLGISLIKSGFSGRTLVDSMNAIGQASAAVGDDVGNKLKGILQRGILAGGREGRFSINWGELVGTGLTDVDVAKPLAKQMGIGVDAARRALLSGRVKLANGAAALREAVEKKFGAINLAKMLDLNVIGEKLKETLSALTKDVHLEPMAEGFAKIAKLFDTSTVTGTALKGIITRIGNGIVDAFSKGTPYAIQFVKGMVIGALQVELAYYQLKNAIKGALGKDAFKGVDVMSLALTVGKVAVYGLVVAVGLLGVGIAAVGVAIALMLSPIIVAAGAFYLLKTAATKVWNWFSAIKWGELGTSIVDGILSGLKSAAAQVVGPVKSMAELIKKTFKSALGIASPSKEFFGYGQDIGAGAEGGIDQSAASVQQAALNLAPSPGTISGGGGSSSTTVGSPIELHIHIDARGAGDGVATGLQAPSFLAALTKAVEDALVGAGIPVMST